MNYYSHFCLHSMFGDRMSSQELNSPESTVTSLLASSGHLRSSLALHPEPLFTVRYKDKDFESASAALDAYIADFERSELKRSPTRIQLLTDRSTSSFPIRSRVRNKDGKYHSLLVLKPIFFCTYIHVGSIYHEYILAS